METAEKVQSNITGAPWKFGVGKNTILLDLAECVIDAGAWLSSSERAYWGCHSSGFSITNDNGGYQIQWCFPDGVWGHDPYKTMPYKEQWAFEQALPALTESIVRLMGERLGITPTVRKHDYPLGWSRSPYLGD